ncbi:DUF5009 domain-containing protein [Bacteroides ihuae]|uniref:DUF5009 domain-containing protein n=1 Tax=Bacteroides ihuae TaxID=1852362 RepID=UPI0008DAD77D|nr:DUF5009 domain-containing protein [Bacteroides ihuae]
MNKRAYALDALRGYAIITMVLSATVAWRTLPGWMYHAQTPPPERAFNASLTGITWVDLVFPFFLFAMGAAFPFSIGKRLEKGESKLRLIYEAVKRGMQLIFFAIFIQHFYPHVLSNPEDVRAWLLAILCFIVLFPMFMRIPIKMSAWKSLCVKMIAYATAVVMMLTTHYADDRIFDVAFNNIIILLLANMAIFGSIIYLFTMNNRSVRIGLLAILMAILLSAQVEGSWTQIIFNYTPLPWAFHFEYLQYLFIVIPGSIAGEYLLEWIKSNDGNISSFESVNKWKAFGLIFLTLALIVINLVGLYTHAIFMNLLMNILLLVTGILLLRRGTGFIVLWRRLFISAAFLIILGLCFEPFQGGIKKDPATFSYLFVTSGLAFMALLLLNIICDYFRCLKSTTFLVMSGQNPMMAYVVGNLFIMPVANLLGVASLLVYFNSNAWMGFLRGVILTALSVLVTMYFTKIKWFWRT